MLAITNPEGGGTMLAKRDDQREQANKPDSHPKSRDEARFKAALRIKKYAPGHKDRPHSSHDNKR